MIKQAVKAAWQLLFARFCLRALFIQHRGIRIQDFIQLGHVYIINFDDLQAGMLVGFTNSLNLAFPADTVVGQMLDIFFLVDFIPFNCDNLLVIFPNIMHKIPCMLNFA